LFIYKDSAYLKNLSAVFGVVTSRRSTLINPDWKSFSSASVSDICCWLW